MRAAYDALDARTKAEVEDLVCEHSLAFSREAIGFTDLTAEERSSVQADAAASGPHPSGDRSEVAVPVGARRHHRRLDRAEARMFLRDLTEFATQRTVCLLA